MTVPASGNPGERRHSSIACHICRKRKIRCGRELPHCSICEQTEQVCTYPERAGRPGPKLGGPQGENRRNSHAKNADKDSHYLAKQRHARRSRGKDEDEQNDAFIIQPDSSPGHSVSSVSSYQYMQNIQEISFIVHPSHESCNLEEEAQQRVAESRSDPNALNKQSTLSLACSVLKVVPEEVNQLIGIFLRTFTSFRLFREPHIRRKLEQIDNGNEFISLVSIMFAFASKSSDFRNSSPDRLDSASQSTPCSGSYFTDMAQTHIELTLKENGDDPPSLSSLQALILLTHWFLIRGVRGRAWRYLGICVNIAYELNLHLIDSGRSLDNTLSNPTQWCEDEEKRRAWWAIWEMDVFASVIRRCPTAIDWSRNDTRLPAEDDKWFRGEAQPSSDLEIRLSDRWKSLQASGNKSAKAWFIVINSLAKEAQATSSPVGIKRSVSNEHPWRHPDGGLRGNNCQIPWTEEAVVNRLSTLYNTLRCCSIALPSGLKYHNQYLNFGANGKDSGSRHLHSAIYSIHILIRLTRLMIHKYHIFRADTQWMQKSTDPNAIETNNKGSITKESVAARQFSSRDRVLNQYFEAADEILLILHNSDEDHYKYVNPFLANTIWLASAVQLLRREIVSTTEEADMVNSNYEVLCMTYKQFVRYWGMPTVLTQNLDTLGKQLQKFKASQQEDQVLDRLNETIESGGMRNLISQHEICTARGSPLKDSTRSNTSGSYLSSTSIQAHMQNHLGQSSSRGAVPDPTLIHAKDQLLRGNTSLQGLAYVAQIRQMEENNSNFPKQRLQPPQPQLFGTFSPITATQLPLLDSGMTGISSFTSPADVVVHPASPQGFINDFEPFLETTMDGGELSTYLGEVFSGAYTNV